MKIRRINSGEAPEINFIPLIDVLLVIVIFLVCTTTFMRQSQLRVELPGTSAAQKADIKDQPLLVKVGKDGNYAFENQPVLDEKGLRKAVQKALGATRPARDQRVLLEADSQATHQSVVTAMDVLASLGIEKVSIATASKGR